MSNPRELLRFVLRPVVRMFVVRSLSYQSFITLAKELFIEVAAEELTKSNSKVNSSRLSALTGLNRLDVSQFLGRAPKKERKDGFLGRLLANWEQHPSFRTKSGIPRPLTCRGERNQFADLVYSINHHLHPGSVLKELERSKLITIKEGVAHLSSVAIEVGQDEARALEVLGTDLDMVIKSAQENMSGANPIKNLFLRTNFDNIVQSHVDTIRCWMLEEGRNFHERARKFLSQFDADLNPEKSDQEAGITFSIGTYSRCEIAEEKSSLKKAS